MKKPIIFDLKGPQLRADSTGDISEKLIRLINEGNTQVILNFETVQFVDSSFLGFLVIILKRATAKGGDIRLCSLNDQILELFKMMRLNRLFQIFSTPEEAQASFNM